MPPMHRPATVSLGGTFAPKSDDDIHNSCTSPPSIAPVSASPKNTPNRGSATMGCEIMN